MYNYLKISTKKCAEIEKAAKFPFYLLMSYFPIALFSFIEGRLMIIIMVNIYLILNGVSNTMLNTLKNFSL